MRNNFLRAVVLACLSASTFAIAAEPRIQWERRLDEAKQIATLNKKDLLINFTGLEWCGWCMVLERAVLGKQEFAPAANDFVLVDLDFPNDRAQLGDLQPLYERWEKEYLIQGFPTVVLADASGRPYAYTGYEKGLTPASFLAELKKCQAGRQARDQALKTAKDLQGAARAQKLHEAIQAVAETLGDTETRRDDPVLAFYGDEVAEIRRLDPDNSQTLRALYDARIAARDQFRQQEERIQDLVQVTGKESYPEAIARLDKLLIEIKDERVQWRLEIQRFNSLQWDEQHAKALETAQRLVKDPRCDLDKRDWLYRRLAHCLICLGRIDEAIACYDEQIAAAADRPDARLSFLDWKANELLSTDRRAECIAAYREFRAATEPFSDEWQEATGLMAMALARGGQYSEAIALQEEELALYRRQGSADYIAGQLIAIARSKHAAGRDDDARKDLDEAEANIPSQVGKPADEKDIRALREELSKLRQKIGIAK